jgi:hypothetical protein
VLKEYDQLNPNLRVVKHTLPPSTFSKVFITSKTLLLISSFERPAEAAYPLADNVSAGRAKERVGRIRGAEATRKEGAALAIAVRNIVIVVYVWVYGCMGCI